MNLRFAGSPTGPSRPYRDYDVRDILPALLLTVARITYGLPVHFPDREAFLHEIDRHLGAVNFDVERCKREVQA